MFRSRFIAWVIVLPIAMSNVAWVLQYYNEPWPSNITFEQHVGLAMLKTAFLTISSLCFWYWYKNKD